MFSKVFDPNKIDTLQQESLKTSINDIDILLRQERFTLADFPKLLSPAASERIEQLAQRSRDLTIQRFGHTMQLFMPLYLSNVCFNTCTYCGFSIENKFKRITLGEDEIIKEAMLLKEKGIQHLLLLTGEAPGKVGVDYISAAVKQLSPHFASIGIEVQPFETDEYETLISSGADSLTLYQETYHPDAYKTYHTRGKKKNFSYRLDAPDKGGKAGFYRINLGALLGLYDWRFESIALATHLDYMQRHYWKTKYAVSFPRIKEMFKDFSPEHIVSDLDIVQFITAFRLVFPDVGITLSTREPASLRNNLIKLGITSMSAESKTAPGAYAGGDAEGQFEISDERSVDEIQMLLKENGFDPVYKDWDVTYIN